MSHNFKPGDLALTIGLSAHNTGRVVELVAYLGAPEWFEVQGKSLRNSNGEAAWLVRALGEPLKPGKKLVKMLGLVPMTEAPILTRCLMPLRGDFTHEQQKAREAV